MKRNTLIILLVILTLVLTVPAALADMPTGGTSGIQVVNLDTSTATVTAVYYAEDGTSYTLDPQELANQGDSYTYYAEPTSADTFAGSAILSADKQIAAIANTGFSSNSAGAAYGGSNTGSTTVLLPLVTKAFGGQTTAIGVQNTDTASQVTAQVTYTPQTGDAVTVDYVLQPGASQIIDLATVTELADNWIGSASIAPADGTTPLVGSAMIYTSNFVYAYSGFTSTGTEWYLPLIRSGFAGALTGVQVVNAGATEVSVDIAYSGAIYDGYTLIDSSYTCTVNAVLPASSSITFYNLNSFNFDTVLGASSASVTEGECFDNGHTSFESTGGVFLGSAKITTNGNVAVVVNDVLGTTSSGAYNGATPAEAATSIISPLARVQFFGITSGTQVQNICTDAVTTQATYQTSSLSQNTTAPTLDPVEIAAGGSYTFFISDSTYAGWLGSLTVAVTGTNGSTTDCLVGITNDAPSSGDASVFNTFAMP
jgi:hypothetical protein